MPDLIDALHSALSKNPNDWALRENLINTLVREGRKQEAEQLLNLITELPGDLPSQLTVARSYAVLDLYKGIEVLDQIITHDSNCAMAYIERGNFSLALGDLENANLAFQYAIQVDPTLGLKLSEPDSTEPAPIAVPAYERISKPTVDADAASLRDAIMDSKANHEDSMKSKALVAKIQSITVAMAVVVIIGLLMVLAVSSLPRPPAPQIVASTHNESVTEDIEQKTLVKNNPTPTPTTSAPSLSTDIVSVASVSSLSMQSFDSPVVGLGASGLSFGSSMSFGQSIGSNGAGITTIFGSTKTGGLVGQFYDLKQDRRKNPTNFAPSTANYDGVFDDFARSKFSESTIREYYKAKRKLSFNHILLEGMPAAEGPKAFAVEKDVEPRAWFVHYTGMLRPPEIAEWRFVGRFDDALRVYINNELVFDGNYLCDEGSDISRIDETSTATISGRRAVAGKWVKLDQNFKIDILIGERPGGNVGGALLVERKGERYEARSDGTAIVPLFTTEKLNRDDKKKIEDFPYDISDKAPVFKVVSNR